MAAADLGFSAEDRLEERLLELLRGGELDLGTAQREIAANWVLAYEKYCQ
jgi:hypothetical protein